MRKLTKLLFLTASLLSISALYSCNKGGDKPVDPTPVTPGEFKDISFKNQTFTYDGKEHSIYCTNVPSFANVTYTGNGKVAVGTYTVTALITAENYKDLSLSAKMTIEKDPAKKDFEGVYMEDLTFTYDGKSYTNYPKNLPSGANYRYVGTSSYSEVGEYTITCVVYKSGYNDLQLSAKLIIVGKDYPSEIVFKDKIMGYTGNSYTITVSGAPSDATVSYKCLNASGTNTFTEIGEYQIEATISKKNYKTITKVATLTILNPNAVSIDTSKTAYTINDSTKWKALISEMQKGNFTIKCQTASKLVYYSGEEEYTVTANGVYAVSDLKAYRSYVPTSLSKYSQPQYDYAQIKDNQLVKTVCYYLEDGNLEFAYYKENKDFFHETFVNHEIGNTLMYLKESQDGGFADSYITDYYGKENGTFKFIEGGLEIHVENSIQKEELVLHEIVDYTICNVGNTKIEIPKVMNPSEENLASAYYLSVFHDGLEYYYNSSGDSYQVNIYINYWTITVYTKTDFVLPVYVNNKVVNTLTYRKYPNFYCGIAGYTLTVAFNSNLEFVGQYASLGSVTVNEKALSRFEGLGGTIIYANN